jgi:hypothetical protein|tara:strand:+ start:252 stop:1673 length:1422 start_codon:yes stop_codon:yes gene_type:complete
MNIIVIDDFYRNADGTREFILTQPFNVVGNFPGKRTTSYANDKIKTAFENAIGKEIIYWPDGYNGSFQYTTSDMNSWVHRDQTSWAAILYLTPEAPVSSGTGFFKHKRTGIENKKQYDKAEGSVKKELDNDSNDMDKWEMIDYVGNKYNRLVLFQGTRNHKSMKYFGKNKNDGRLFQLWFFNTGADLNQSQPKWVPRPLFCTQCNVLLNIPLGKKVKKKKNICILFFTTSRYEYLIPTMESFHSNVDFGDNNIYKILIDDYPLRRNEDILNKLVEKYNIDKLILNDENMGYSATWKKMWQNIPKDMDYIWHQEDDFTFNKKVHINSLISILENKKIQLFQIFLKRNIVFEKNDYIRNIENNTCGEKVVIDEQELVLCNHYFNPNPCLYPYWITQENYAENPQETPIINYLKKKYTYGYSAMFGGRNDDNIINHIGEYTQGKKVLKGEPGWDWLKEYDPDKKYYSAGYLKEFTD